jgi:hypothetical protein
MTEHEFESIVQAQQDEIDRRLNNPGDCELSCHQVSEGWVMGMLTLSHPNARHKTFVLSGREPTGEIAHEWDHDIAAELFLLYITQYSYWKNPIEGAVSPALSDFFTYSNPQVPALVNWARWLRIDHESDERIDTFDPEVAEVLVEAMIAETDQDADVAAAMRRAVRGESIGARDPNQIELF